MFPSPGTEHLSSVFYPNTDCTGRVTLFSAFFVRLRHQEQNRGEVEVSHFTMFHGMTGKQRRHTDTVMRDSDGRDSVVKPSTRRSSSSSSSQVTSSSCCSAVTIRKYNTQQTPRTRPCLDQASASDQKEPNTARHCSRKKASLPAFPNYETNRNRMARKKRNDSFSR